MSDLLTISSSAFSDQVHVVAFRAKEALGSPYEVEIFLTLPAGDELDVSEAAGAKATLTLDRKNDEAPLRWSGVLLEVSILAELGERTLVRAVLMPRLARAAQVLHTRVFIDKTLKDITSEVLDKNGLRDGDDFALEMNASYPTEEHVAEWHESDLDFLHRWFEREGVYYWFEQGEESEKLRICDANPTGDAMPVRFHALVSGDVTAGPCLTKFRCDGRALVGVVKVVDRDYASPALEMQKEEDVSDFPGEHVLHHARLIRSADVGRIAKTRQETMKAVAKIYQAEGSKLGLSPGAIFHLDEHPRAAFANDYLVTTASHVGWNEVPGGDIVRMIDLETPDGPSGLYHVRITAIEKGTPFRLQRRTPWPRVDGYETAIVDGPAESDYAQIDDMGRYKVRYHADESMGEDGVVSTWLRMMQPHTGAPEGMHFPLRKNTEVIVSFLGGDPDRPVILGAVPNGITPSVVTKKNHTQNRLFTGGGTTLEIEDLAGGQYVHWYTPVDHTHFHMGAPRKIQGKDAPPHETKASLGWSTDGNAVLSVGGEWDIGVGAKLHEVVKGEVIEEYKTSRTETVNGPVTEHYEGKHTLTIDKGQKVTIQVGKDDTIDGGWTQKIHGGWRQTEITGGWTQSDISGGWVQMKIAGGWNQFDISGGWIQRIHGGWTQLPIDGGWTQNITGGWNQSVDLVRQVVGQTFFQSVTGKTMFAHDGGRTEIVGGPGVLLISPKCEMIGASWKQLDADLFEVKGKKLTFAGLKVDIVAGVSFGVSAVKIDLVGMKLGNKGVLYKVAGADGKSGGLEWHLKGLTTWA